uniref:Syntaphilin a n=1 Tax=Nothobranchius kadleci TaxID=1051664 RepID=A0A1A8BIH0_NOTKA
MSLTPSRKPSSSQRRRSVGAGGGGGRCSHSDSSSTHTFPVRLKPSEGSLTPRTHPNTPRRQLKHTFCSDNHGIKPPTPEQYLTPLQQKEVCIRHLRSRLRENVERLQHRDCEIEELRTQLYKMQEDWIEGECHRVEAQLALKEARKEIQQLHEVVESVKSNLSIHEQESHDHKPYLGLQGVRAGEKSRSCGCSPASTLSRGTTFTRRSSEALQLERSPEFSGGARPAGQTHLLLEAALLSEQLPQRDQHIQGTPAVPRSSTFERLCSGGAVLPISHSCHSLGSSCRCSGHASLPHHHLFLHLPQEEPPVPSVSAAAAAPATHTSPIVVPAAEKKPEVRSQACSPTMTWLCEESSTAGLSVISSSKMDITSSEPWLPISLPPQFCPSTELPPSEKPEAAKVPARIQTCQPQPIDPLPVQQQATVLEIDEDHEEKTDGGTEAGPSPEPCHWSPYFLVDLLALAMPMVPTMAWLCRGAPQEVMPAYHIGSLLRGCCAVALHSLRRQGAGRGRRPTSIKGTALL